MADKDSKEENANNTKVSQSWFSAGGPGRVWLYGLGALVIVFIIFMIGVAAGNYNNWHYGMHGDGYYGRYMDYNDMPMGHFGGYFNSQNRVIGVVTAVDGNSFTVASNGSTQKITTDSSTQYQGGNQVKVNDTVVVTGSGSALTADNIVINP